MKKILCLVCLTALTLVVSGCRVQTPRVAAQSPAAAPALSPTGYESHAPDSYVWDGSEYVGFQKGQYVYWTGGAWIAAPPIIVERFQDWERLHPDWRTRAMIW